MRKILLILTALLCSLTTIYAQGFGYDEKIDLGNGLYKVKSGNYYGIIDANDNVVASIEFQDILFKNGKALLTKDDKLLGVIDTTGLIKSFKEEYIIHPKFRYIYEGYILVSPIKKWQLGYNKWGYITENGEPLKMVSKMRGAYSYSKKSPTFFDDVTPFVDGISSVYIKKSGWKHIDKNGQERYILGNKKNKASFRSSVYKDECIIIAEDGIKQYQENNNHQAVVKRILANSASFIEETQDKHPSIIYKEGRLYLDSLRRVVKFENNTDSIIFIVPPRKIVVKKPTIIENEEVPTINESLAISLSSKNVQANNKGRAYVTIIIKNKSNTTYKNISIKLKSIGANRDWSGDIDQNSELKLSLNIPAKFSSKSISSKIFATVSDDKNNIEEELIVIVKRYTPIRSR